MIYPLDPNRESTTKSNDAHRKMRPDKRDDIRRQTTNDDRGVISYKAEQRRRAQSAQG